jgi:stage V sporulation protein D (sporulation-specific penicillin-binding protein)
MEKQSGKTTKPFNSRMQARLLLVFCVVTLLLVGLMARLIYITQTDGDRYAKQVLSRQSYVSSVLPYKRGDIIDCNGTVLATSQLLYRLILDPKLLIQNQEYIDPTTIALSDSFGIAKEDIQKILTDKPDSQYVIVMKNLKYDTVKSFETLMEEKDSKITGVWFEEDYVRTYPFNTLASDVLGFTSTDNTGYWGIEEYYNEELNGTNGREYGYYDSELNVERIVKKAINGNSVITSLDANVQRIIQKKIIDFNTEFGSKSIGVLVMNPNNGEIIAMASNQEYDLNNPRNLEGIYTAEELAAMTEEQKTEALNALWKNDVISSTFEPGSTFKPVTIAAAMEEGVVTADNTYLCDGGEQVGDTYIHCSKRTGHGELTLAQALMVSCNDALMQIADAEGKDIFLRYQNSFGFGAKTGIDLPGEEVGILHTVDNTGATELATSSFGQTFTTTMIQMAAAFSSLVNGGYYYQPHVVKQIVNDNGATVKDFNELLVRETVSKETSDFIQEALYQTVEQGTAGGAKVEGYSVGGKTGTAQKLPRDAKTYVVSFLGCAPAINPEIVIYVVIDEPQNVEKQADSSIATKFASKILKEILPALGIYPEGDIDYLLSDDQITGTPADGTSPATTDNTNGTPDGQADTQTQDTQTQDTQTQDTQTQDTQTQDTQTEDTQTEDTQTEDTQTEDTTGLDNAVGQNPESTVDPSGTEDNNAEDGTPADNAGDDEYNPDALD